MRTKKLWNSKTTLKQWSNVFDIVPKQIVLLVSYLITCAMKPVCDHAAIAMSHVHWTI